MKNQNKHWIIYDGNCGMCLFSKKVFSRIGFIREADCRNYHELSPAHYQKIDLQRFKHGMAYIHEGDNPTLYGLEGVLAAFSEKRPYIKAITPNTWLFRLLNFLYMAICYNRYFIFPMKQQFACSCEPDYQPQYFRRWIGLGLFFSIFISALFGMSLSVVFNMPAGELALRTVIIVGAGWALQIVLAALLMNQELFRDYLRHIALIMFIGVLILVPSTLLFWLPPAWLAIVALVSVVASSFTMLRMHFQRIRFMGLGQQWTLGWFASLQLTAIPLMFHFGLFTL